MTPAPAVHLSEEAIHDVLIGLSSAETDAHVAVCAVCRGQVEQFRSDMQLFDDAALAWAKSKPMKSLPVPAPWRVRQAILAPAGWAMAAAVLLMMAIPTWMHDRSAQPAQTAVGSEYGDSAEQIAQDNDLLRSVDVALNPNQDSAYRKLTSDP